MKKCRFVSEDFVRVTEGPFEGVVGRVARVARQNRVVVYIEGLQAGLQLLRKVARHHDRDAGTVGSVRGGRRAAGERSGHRSQPARVAYDGRRSGDLQRPVQGRKGPGAFRILREG